MNKKFLMIAGAILAGLVSLFLIYNTIVNLNLHKAAPHKSEDDRSALFSKAQKLLAQGDDDAAMGILQRLIIDYPDSTQAESAYFTLASIYEKRNDLLNAKELYQKVMEKFPNSNNILKTQEALDDLNIKILFSPTIHPQDSSVYEVRKADSLSKIAKRFDTTIELIAKANNLKSDTVRIGQKLKIPKTKFSIVVDKSQNILTLKADGNVLKTYKVSTGKDFSTPIGTFKITNKIIDPVWYTAGAVVPAGSPNNILGSRWLGISKPGYGIHGTTDPKSIGSQITAGCVRMTNPDVEEVYSIVPDGTEVVIVD